MNRRRFLFSLGALSSVGLHGCGGAVSEEPPPANTTDRATGWTQMPVATYNSLPPVGGAIPFDGGLPTFDLADSVFLAKLGEPLQLPSPGNQGSQSSCTAWAVGYASATQTMRGSRASLPAAISPADLFAKIRNRLSPSACTQGSQISDAMDVLVQEGAATIDVAPYSQSQCGITSTARTYNLDGFSRVDAADNVSIRGGVQSKQPVCFGILVDHAFQALNSTNSVWVPSGAGSGHALTIIGYDDSRQLYKVLNSWGTDWGQSGYFYISYANFARYALDVCIPFLRRSWENSLLSSTKSNAISPISVQHMYARPYGRGEPGSYGVGVEMGWSSPLAVTAASISVMDNSENILFTRNFSVSQIARGLRFGGSVPDASTAYTLVRSSITGRDSSGTSQTLTATTRPAQR